MNQAARPSIPNGAGHQVAPLKPIDSLRNQLTKMEPEFQTGLPQHIPVDRFKRVVLTAANQNQDLLLADRRSLMGACMRAAQDGLLPDGRDGALVIFNTKIKDDAGQERWVKAVQWMPMVYGIIKKMRNSGELASIVAHEVYQRDHFKYRLGDDEMIEHEPYLGSDEPGPMVAVYAIAKLKDGTLQREVMTRSQVEKVRSVSRSKDRGPWVSWFEEMARKTVIRRLSKYLPMSTEIEEMLRREDVFSAQRGRHTEDAPSVFTIDGDMDETAEAEAAPESVEVPEQPAAQPAAQPPKQQSRRVPPKSRAQSAPAAETPHDPETGEIEDVPDDRGEPEPTEEQSTQPHGSDLF